MALSAVALSAVVVIPARDEEARIGACLTALAAQTVARNAFETIVVLDGCTDSTAAVAERTASALGLPLMLIDGPGEGSGPARRIGMDLAAERLLECGRPDGLIACTDADTQPTETWLERQLDHVGRGAEVIAGYIELDPDEAMALPVGALRRRERDSARRLHGVRELDASAEHHHFAGASLGVTAAAYTAVGGIEPVTALEDAAFAVRLGEHGIAILRPEDVRVRTSARRAGRACRGLSVDLEIASWFEHRRYNAADFPLERLRELKGSTSIAVVIPTKECGTTIAGLLEHTVAPSARSALIDEIVVVDAGSADGTNELARRAGARVVQQDDVLTDFGPALGKGDAMWRSLAVTDADVVCFLDGDTEDPDPLHLQGLIGPLLADPALQLV